MTVPCFERIPRELVERPRWVLWRRFGKRKIPFCCDTPERKASPVDPATWGSFDATRAAYHKERDGGIGFALNRDGLAAVDIDHSTSNAAVELLRTLGCGYIELSPSGEGLHGWGFYAGNLPRKKGTHQGLNVEIYNGARYMSVTGNAIHAEPLAELPALHELSKQLCRQPTQETQETQVTQDSQVRGWGYEGDSADIEKYVPQAIGQRNRCLFDLARHVKARYPDASRDDLRAIVREWHRLALPNIGTTEFSASWGDFMRGLEAVQFPEGILMAELLKNVDFDRLPVGIPPDYEPRTKRLVRICGRLQRHAGSDPFFLSARMAGELVKVHFTVANGMLNGLVADGVLEREEPGRLRGRRAAQYRMLIG